MAAEECGGAILISGKRRPGCGVQPCKRRLNCCEVRRVRRCNRRAAVALMSGRVVETRAPIRQFVHLAQAAGMRGLRRQGLQHGRTRARHDQQE